MFLLNFPFQRMSLYHFGDLHSYPYHYMPTPGASIPALSISSSSSSEGRGQHFGSPQPWLRFSPYMIPTSAHLKQKTLSGRISASSSSFSEGRRHSGPAFGNSKHRTDAGKIINVSTNDLHNIPNLMTGLHKVLPRH